MRIPAITITANDYTFDSELDGASRVGQPASTLYVLGTIAGLILRSITARLRSVA